MLVNSLHLAIKTNSYDKLATLLNDSLIECSTEDFGNNINKYVFKELKNLKTIKITNNIKNIDREAFYNCTNLTNLTIEDGLESIGYQAFYGCGSLTNLELPISLNSIDTSAFQNCSNIMTVSYRGSVDDWVKINFNGQYSNPLYYAMHLFINNIELQNVNTNVNINNYSFINCLGLTDVTLGPDVSEIGVCAFDGCTNLQNITILNNKSDIQLGNLAFYGCKNLNFSDFDLEVPVHVKYQSFCKNTIKDKTLTIPGNFIISGTYAFSECDMTTVILSEGITDTGEYTFRDCTSLVNVTLPESLEVIGRYAFADDTRITKIVVPAKVKSIGTYAFDTGLTEIWFMQPADMEVTIPSDNLFDSTKSSRSIKVYCENEVFKKYNYSNDNYNPTFYHLDGTKWE